MSLVRIPISPLRRGTKIIRCAFGAVKMSSVDLHRVEHYDLDTAFCVVEIGFYVLEYF